MDAYACDNLHANIYTPQRWTDRSEHPIQLARSSLRLLVSIFRVTLSISRSFLLVSSKSRLFSSDGEAVLSLLLLLSF